MKPHRVQLSRAKGWRMPPNTVSVARPSKWGNPYKPAQYWAAGFKGSRAVAIAHCVDAHRAWLERKAHFGHPVPQRPVPDLSPLRGKNLACWCSLDHPCHADILLEIANR